MKGQTRDPNTPEHNISKTGGDAIINRYRPTYSLHAMRAVGRAYAYGRLS